MEIAVFGASGRTGRHVVQQGVARGHEVTAFVRDASQIPTADRLTVAEGDARDPVAAEGALAGRDAVISVLSLASAQDEPEHSEATRAIVEAAVRAGIRRIVVTANNDVFGDEEVAGEFAAHAREHRRNRATLEDSALDWTIGAAPWVVDEPVVGSYVTELDGAAPGRKISTVDLATFVLDALEREAWVGHLLGVSN